MNHTASAAPPVPHLTTALTGPLLGRPKTGTFRLNDIVGIDVMALVGGNLPNLTYMLAFDSLTQREQAWGTFVSSPEWKKLSSQPDARRCFVARPARGICP